VARILIIDDDTGVSETMQSLAGRMRHEAVAARTLGEGLRRLAEEPFDIVFLDVRLPDGNGLEAIPTIRKGAAAPEVIILTGQGDPDGAELAIQGGAWDYLVKPSPVKQTMLSIERAIKYREQKRRELTPVSLNLENVVGRSPVMQSCFDLVAAAARSNASVLITGETGTGKELFARTIRANSQRRYGPFVVVDCAALPANLVESILFGHRKGAFTGADRDAEGLVKAADGGTLFLDEVGELPLPVQRSFLRVLQERRFRPVGASAETTSDFRLVAATNRDLEAMVGRGEFRQDLLFRLKTISLRLPPLRERREDIRPLAVWYVDKLCEGYGLAPKGFDQDFFAVLTDYVWPGNVRELFNVLERALVASGSEKTLYAMHLPQDVRIKVTKANLERGRPAEGAAAPGAGLAPGPGAPEIPAAGQPQAPAPAFSGPSLPSAQPAASSLPDDLPEGSSLKEFKDAMERRYLSGLLARHGQDLQAMLDLSGLSRSHFYALLKKHDLTAA
jgi:two-component system NtrC family response regulator